MFKRILGAAAIAAALATPSLAQDDQVLATVNGTPITAADVAAAYDTLGATAQQMPEANRDEMVLNLLVDMQLLADAAEQAGIADDPTFDTRMEQMRAQLLRQLYVESVVDEAVTDEAVRARYEEEAAKLGDRQQVSARHILVEDKETAEEVISKLKEGADFSELATEYSQDPGSAQKGGSLGFIGRGQMVPEFEEAAFALDEGEFTEEPVQSQFGWHVIQVDEKRTQEPPSFEQVGERIRELMMREAYVKELERLKENAEIEMTSEAASAE